MVSRSEDPRGARADGTGVGLGLRSPHLAEILQTHPAVGWFEVHAENYFGNGPGVRRLEEIRRDYPVSLHGVGLSLGSADGIEPGHLSELRALADRIDPIRVSEHLSWSVAGGAYLNDLLPLPYTEETLEIVCRNVERTQETLGRTILVENPSSYLRFGHSSIPEPTFLSELAQRTGCGLLCDVNNIYVSSQNLGLDALAYLDDLSAVPAGTVGEIHLAGHARLMRGGRPMLIDDHGSRVAPAVWTLYAHALRRFGDRVPVLIEWDKNLPELSVLLDEAQEAQRIAERTSLEQWECDVVA